VLPQRASSLATTPYSASRIRRVSDQLSTTNTPGHADEHDREDLGFGSVVAQQVRGRFLNRDGTASGQKMGLGPQRLEHLYLGALSASWTSFLAWSLSAVMLVNGCFTLAYRALGPQAIGGQDASQISDPFLSAFSFSMAVFTTSSTGSMYAVGATANWLRIIESLAGPLTMVAVSGLIIARLIRPRMRIRFSESAVVAPYDGGRGLMFRMVGMQRSSLSDVQVRVNLALFEMQNGQRTREFYQLELERGSVEFFTLHWTIVHPITETSPLRGFTPEMLRAAEAELLISVNAHEETFSTRVTARTSYLYNEVRWDAKFANIFVSAPEGQIAIDVERLDRMDPLPEGTTSSPAPSEGALVEQPVGRS
jgi:inward rectifier potassium channel